MKKISIVYMSIIVILLGACITMGVILYSKSNPKVESKVKEEVKSTASDYSKEDEEINKEAEVEVNEDTIESDSEIGKEIELKDIDDMYLSFEGSETAYWFLNADKSVYKTVRMDDFLDRKSEFFEHKEDTSVYGICGKEMCLAVINFEEQTQEIYIYNIDTDSMICVTEDAPMGEVVFVNGEVFVEVSDYGEDSTTYSTVHYVKHTEQNFTAEIVYEKINKMRTEKELMYRKRYYGNNVALSTAYCMTRFNLTPYVGNDGIEIVSDKELVVKSIPNIAGKKYSIEGWDGQNLVYTTIDEATSRVDGIYLSDMSSKEYFEVFTCEPKTYEEEPRLLDMEDGIIYYSLENTDEDGINSAELFAYDINRNETKSLMTSSCRPGHDAIYVPLRNGFKVMGSDVFYVGESEGATEWFRLLENGESTPVGAVVKEYEYVKYGTVSKFRKTQPCPYCDKLSFEENYEYFLFNEDIENADKMNEVIIADYEEAKRMADEFVPEYIEQDCRDYIHADGNDMRTSVDEVVTDVKLILDKYYFIQKDASNYMVGAAHGYPGFNNYLFDAKTGERLEASDVINMDENKFKQIVLNAVRNQYDEIKDRVFADNVDDLVSQVSEEISFDYNITFYDAYLTVDFMPYDLGSYADGIIPIKVTYKELGMEDEKAPE